MILEDILKAFLVLIYLQENCVLKESALQMINSADSFKVYWKRHCKSLDQASNGVDFLRASLLDLPHFYRRPLFILHCMRLSWNAIYRPYQSGVLGAGYFIQTAIKELHLCITHQKGLRPSNFLR